MAITETNIYGQTPAQQVRQQIQQQFGSSGNVISSSEINSGIPNRTGLPDDRRAGVESLSGIAMDDVQVHYNSSRPAALNALAYAQGSDIFVAPGQDQTLAHEAWHVVQQRSGRG